MRVFRKIEQNKYFFVYLAIAVVFFAIFTIGFYHFNTPFKRANYDSFTQIAQMDLWKNGIKDTNLFPGIFKDDLRVVLYPKVWALVSMTFKLDDYKTLYINGLLNLGLNIIALLYVANFLKINKNHKVLFILLFFFSVSSFWEYNDIGFTIFSFPDLLINAFYPQIFANALLIFIIGFLYNYFSAENLRKRIIYLMLIITFVFITFLVHLFTAILSIIVIFIFSFSRYREDKKNLKKGLFVLIAAIIIGFATLLVPNYNWLNYILSSATNLQTSPIAQGTASSNYYSLQARSSILGISVIGIALAFHRKSDSFMKIFALFFFLISLSFILPFKIPYFWRFTNFVRLPLAYLTVLAFMRIDKYRIIKVFLIMFLMIASVGLIFKNSNINSDVAYLTFINNYENKIFLADDIESNYIQSVNHNQTITIPLGHISNGELLNLTAERLVKMKNFYEGDVDSLKVIIKQYKVNYLLLNKFSNYYNYQDLLLFLPYKITFENEKYILFEV